MAQPQDRKTGKITLPSARRNAGEILLLSRRATLTKREINVVIHLSAADFQPDYSDTATVTACDTKGRIVAQIKIESGVEGSGSDRIVSDFAFDYGLTSYQAQAQVIAKAAVMIDSFFNDEFDEPLVRADLEV